VETSTKVVGHPTYFQPPTVHSTPNKHGPNLEAKLMQIDNTIPQKKIPLPVCKRAKVKNQPKHASPSSTNKVCNSSLPNLVCSKLAKKKNT
jgi:hypothetical protein